MSLSASSPSPASSSSSVPRVVIIGGGFAGLDAARALKRAPVSVTLVDRYNHHVFQPLLYQVATAGLSPGDIASPIRWILRRQKNARVLLATVAAIDLRGQGVQLAGGEVIPYDYLLIATGATHSYFGHDEWAGPAPGLKTLDDALRIRRRVLMAFEQAERESDRARQRELLTFVVVGGGPTGVELAGTLIEIARHTLHKEYDTVDPESARVVLIEAGPTVLSTFPEPLRDAARRSLRTLGVEVWERTRVTRIIPGAVYLGDERVAAHTILWAAGVAASPVTRSLGVALDAAGRVIVEKDLSIPGFPNVFVAGDLASFVHQTGAPLPGVAQVAKQGGAHVARMIQARLHQQPSEPFIYRDVGNMATIGRASAVADLGWLRLRGFPAWLFWLFVHILFLIGFRNRLSVLLQWATSYLTYQRSVRLITGEEEERAPT